MRNEKLFFYISIVIVAVDQVLKQLIRSSSMHLDITRFFSLSYTYNTGAAFGMLPDTNLFLAGFATVIVTLIAYYFEKMPQKMLPYAALLFGGVLGNLIDRVMWGYVIDFINISIWPAFNIADVAITAGVLGLIYCIYKE